MRVGIYTDLRNPPGWRRPWAEHYARTMDRIAEAERLGADSVWVTEHHFFEDGYLPQPLTMAAAKFAIRQTGMDPAARDLEQLARLLEICFNSEDYREGRRAFMEKRKPNFQGK